METETIHKAKTELSRLIEKACRGEEIVKISYSADAFAPLADQELKDLGFE
jgi:hypothetical protein